MHGASIKIDVVIAINSIKLCYRLLYCAKTQRNICLNKRSLSTAVFANYYVLTSMLHSAHCSKQLQQNHQPSLTSSHNKTFVPSSHFIIAFQTLPVSTLPFR